MFNFQAQDAGGGEDAAHGGDVPAVAVEEVAEGMLDFVGEDRRMVAAVHELDDVWVDTTSSLYIAGLLHIVHNCVNTNTACYEGVGSIHRLAPTPFAD